MRLRLSYLLIIAIIGIAKSEDVEVVEAVVAGEDTQESHEHAQDRGDENTDQQAMESNNRDGAQSNHVFSNLPPQNHLISQPPRRSGVHDNVGLVPPPPQLPKSPFGGHRHKTNVGYHGPPPPLTPPLKSQPQQQQQAMEKFSSINDIWPEPVQDMPKIISLDVKCEKNLMKVYLSFDKPFYGIVFSKGHYSNVNCVHLPAGLGRTSAHFEIGIHECGTTGNTENGLYGYGADSGSGTYFENIIVIQYDPQVQEVWDQARKLRCTWHDQYEKSVTFRPFPVDMLDVVRADFAGDNVGCWMQIQVGKGPWASEVSGLVKIGQTMTMVLAIKDDDSKFDMLVRNCMAHDGKRAPIQLVDQKGCVTRPKLMSRFTKIKNFGASASVLSYAHFQAFKFPDSMEVHFQCTIQICRYQCPDQCSEQNALPGPGVFNGHLDVQAGAGDIYGPPPPLPLEAYLHTDRASRPRDERRIRDLTFSLDDNANVTTPPTMVFPGKEELLSPGLICMTTPGFTVTLIVLLGILLVSCLASAYLYLKMRPFGSQKSIQSGSLVTFSNNSVTATKKTKSCFYVS